MEIDLGQTIAIVANIAVITGIVFLGIEIRQNNESLREQARATRLTTSQAAFVPVLQSPELLKALAAEAETDPARMLTRYYFQYILVGWEYSWREVQLGALPADRLPINAWIGFDAMHPRFSEHWLEHRRGFDHQFREFLDVNVMEKSDSQ